MEIRCLGRRTYLLLLVFLFLSDLNFLRIGSDKDFNDKCASLARRILFLLHVVVNLDLVQGVAKLYRQLFRLIESVRPCKRHCRMLRQPFKASNDQVFVLEEAICDA